MNKDILIEAGLTSRESDAYLALLELDEALVTDISKKTKENRTHLYDTLSSLLQKGLVSYVIKNGKKYFRPAPPEKIVEYLREKQRLVEENLPILKSLHKPRVEPTNIEIYEGPEGIKTVLNDVLREGKEWMCLGSTGRSPELLPFFLEHFHKQRIKQKIPLRVIYNNDELGIKRGGEVKKQKYTQVKYMEKTSPTTTYIYGTKVVIIHWKKDKLIAIMIEDKEISESYKSYFDLLWKLAKR